jgi:polyferredoxin
MKDSLEQEKRLPATADYWKVVAIFFTYFTAVLLLTTGGWMYGKRLNLPDQVFLAIGFGSGVIAAVVLIWGAVFASRQIRAKAGFASSPDGVILMLFATGISAFLISLPFGIDANVFCLVSLPFVVWVYLAILQRRFGRLGSPADPAQPALDS